VEREVGMNQGRGRDEGGGEGRGRWEVGGWLGRGKEGG